MGPIGSPETSLKNYHYALRNSQQEHSLKIIFSLSTVYRHIGGGHYLEVSGRPHVPAALPLGKNPSNIWLGGPRNLSSQKGAQTNLLLMLGFESQTGRSLFLSQ